MPSSQLPQAIVAGVDAIFERFAAGDGAPGVVYGVVADGELVHSGGLGSIHPDGTGRPDADTRYRIASLTKSFTAAAILRLRDDGALRLDDEIQTWIPELDPSVMRTSADAASVTIRSLLTMSSGLPADDPWADRQLGLDEATFLRFLETGPPLAWPVDSHLEYASTGYAILGLVVGRASGEGYRPFVERRILDPLGLTRTTFDIDGIAPEEVAPGFVRRDGRWTEERSEPDGAFGSMGGLFSTVRDLATWVATLLAASPPRDDPDAAIPLRRSTLREMQQLRRADSPELEWASAGLPPAATVSGYGYGLFVVLDPQRGRIVTHSGGLPGYGANMRWHPASGLGVVAAANGRYAPLSPVCRDALNGLLDGAARPARRPKPWPETSAARATIERLIEAWDDELAERTFALNVALDEPFAHRRAEIDRIHAVHGRLRPDDEQPPVSDTPGFLRWWMTGERGGRVAVEILLGPERPPRVQSFALTSVPEPSGRLREIADRVVALLAEARPAWPADLELADVGGAASIERDVRAADALFGPLGLGPVIGGDGRTSATWRLVGQRGPVDLSIGLDPDGAKVRSISLVPHGPEMPLEAD